MIAVKLLKQQKKERLLKDFVVCARISRKVFVIIRRCACNFSAVTLFVICSVKLDQ